MSRAKCHQYPRAQERANIPPLGTVGALGSATVCKSAAWATLQPSCLSGSAFPLKKKRRKNPQKPPTTPPLSAQSSVPSLLPLKLCHEGVKTQRSLFVGVQPCSISGICAASGAPSGPLDLCPLPSSPTLGILGGGSLSPGAAHLAETPVGRSGSLLLITDLPGTGAWRSSFLTSCSAGSPIVFQGEV